VEISETQTCSQSLDCLCSISLSITICRSAIWLVHLAHDTSIHFGVRRGCTSTPYFMFFACTEHPPRDNHQECTPGIDEVYIRTRPIPPSSLAFPLSMRSSSLFSPPLVPDSDLPTSTSLQDPLLLVDVSMIFLIFFIEFYSIKTSHMSPGTFELTETAVRERKVSKLRLYIRDQF